MCFTIYARELCHRSREYNLEEMKSVEHGEKKQEVH